MHSVTGCSGGRKRVREREGERESELRLIKMATGREEEVEGG